VKIQKATMEVVDRLDDTVPDEPKVTLDGKDEGLDLTIRRDRDGRLEAEIRYEPKDADLASEWGNDNDYVLLDWFMVHDVDIRFHGGRMTITGYMAGSKGFRRNGEAQYADGVTSGRGNAYTDDGGPLVRVKWSLR
jgi:hypothetical protein